MALTPPDVEMKELISIPAFSDAEMRRLMQEGYTRIGVLPLILNQAKELLMLEHRPTPKTEDHAWGPLGETSGVVRTDGGWSMEPPVGSVLRGLHEELGVAVSIENFRTQQQCPVFFVDWPKGGNSLEPNVYGICPVLIADTETVTRLETSTGSNEVYGSRFMPIEEAYQLQPLRPGVENWLGKVAIILDTVDASLLTRFMPPAPFELEQDAVLNELYP